MLSSCACFICAELVLEKCVQTASENERKSASEKTGRNINDARVGGMAQLLVVGYLRETVNSIRECVFRDYAGLDPNSAKLISQLNIKMTELGLPLEPVQDPRDRDYLIKLQIILRLDKSSEETLIGFINRTEQKAVTFDWQLRIRCILDARSKILCCIVNQNQLYYNPTVKNSMQCKTELEDHGAEDAPLRGLLAQLKALRASTARAPLGAHSVKLEGHRHLLPGRTARKWQYGPLKNHLRKAREYMEADFYRRSWKQKAKACPSQSEFRIPDAAALLTLEKYKKNSILIVRMLKSSPWQKLI